MGSTSGEIYTGCKFLELQYSGVPVEVWQRFFIHMYGEDDAAQMILKYWGGHTYHTK